MIVHDIIKIKLSRCGYLPDYPPYLISDAEMCNAFFSVVNSESARRSSDWFHDNYPEPASFHEEYQQLEQAIQSSIVEFINSTDPDAELPNWIYTYMMGYVIGPNSDVVDRHNLLVLIGEDNKDDEFTDSAYHTCLLASQKWLAKYDISRPPTMFAEPHVIKYFRLIQSV